MPVCTDIAAAHTQAARLSIDHIKSCREGFVRVVRDRIAGIRFPVAVIPTGCASHLHHTALIKRDLRLGNGGPVQYDMAAMIKNKAISAMCHTHDKGDFTGANGDMFPMIQMKC